MSKESKEKEAPQEKTPIEKLRPVMSQLQELEYYSRSNMEKLTEFWVHFEAEPMGHQFADKITTLMNDQAKFQEDAVKIIEEMKYTINQAEQGT